DLVADLCDVLGLGPSLPAQLALVHEAFEAAADVDEEAEVAPLRDAAADLLTRLETLEERLRTLARLLLEDRSPADDEPLQARTRGLNVELRPLAEQRLGIVDLLDHHAADRAERAQPVDEHVEAAAVEAEDE